MALILPLGGLGDGTGTVHRPVSNLISSQAYGIKMYAFQYYT